MLELVEREKVTVLPGPPTLYHSLLAARGQRDLSSLRVAVTGAADIPVELIRRVRRELPFQAIITGYGLTEAGHRHRVPARRLVRGHRHDRRHPV